MMGLKLAVVLPIVGVLLLLLWIPLRERPGLGTVLNATLIGIVVDVTLPIIGESDQLVVRILMMLGGIVSGAMFAEDAGWISWVGIAAIGAALVATVGVVVLAKRVL